jgi:hypothetical protein
MSGFKQMVDTFTGDLKVNVKAGKKKKPKVNGRPRKRCKELDEAMKRHGFRTHAELQAATGVSGPAISRFRKGTIGYIARIRFLTKLRLAGIHIHMDDITIGYTE